MFWDKKLRRWAEAVRARADLPAHPHRSRRAQQRHAGIVDQLLADLAAAQHQATDMLGRTDI